MSLQQWYSSLDLEQIQKKFLCNQRPVECQSCADQEKFGKSLRLENNQAYHNQRFIDTQMNFIDYRASNICNYKCRSCAPVFSNGIAHEVKQNPGLRQFFHEVVSEKVVKVNSNNFDYVIQNLGQVERLMFTGGEPTTMPEVKLMLTEIMQKAHDRISVLITTNGSFTDNFWFDINKKIHNLHWTLSLDAVDKAAGIVRHGTDWNVVAHNAKWLAANAHSFTVNTVVSNLNILQLKPLLKFVQTLKDNSNGMNGCEHRFHVCARPYLLAADNLTFDMLVQARQYVADCQKTTQSQDQLDILKSLEKILDVAKFNENLWVKSKTYNEILDKIRGQNHLELFEPAW